MGYGDDIMSTAFAEAVLTQHEGHIAVFGNPNREAADYFHDPKTNKLRVHWSEVYENHPAVLQPGGEAKDIVCIPEYPGHRHYIDYAKSTTDGNRITKFAFNPEFRAPKGSLFFTDQEAAWAGSILSRLPEKFCLIEPNVKGTISGDNKAWPRQRWQGVVKALPDIPFVQTIKPGVKEPLGPYERMKLLDGVQEVATDTFRKACLILSGASLFVGTDGGLHHAAAALGVPSVVLWSHYSSPDILGYADHVNIRHAEGIGCGSLDGHCPECREAMDAITVEEVTAAVKGAFL